MDNIFGIKLRPEAIEQWCRDLSHVLSGPLFLHPAHFKHLSKEGVNVDRLQAERVIRMILPIPETPSRIGGETREG